MSEPVSPITSDQKPHLIAPAIAAPYNSAPPMSSTSVSRDSSIAARALMALLLMVGFYMLAVGVSAALLWIPYAEYVYLDRVDLRIALGCIGAAAAILWALLPRADKFTPPGPHLARTDAPYLFEIIERVARTTGQEMPTDVFLINDVNAWVTHRGGVMGFGSRRVMGIGLPLMCQLSARELEAVIAHEFGHYISGDVSLGPWIYKTRAAIGRTVAGLDESILQAPFNWYGRFFLKTTLAVSRHQEFAADRTGAKVAGSAAMISALRRVAELAPAYPTYLASEVIPLLQAGLLPPVAEGFQTYLAQRAASIATDHTSNERTTGADAGEFDTHPPLIDRVQALSTDEVPATTVNDDRPIVPAPETLFRRSIEFSAGSEHVAQLRTIAWNDLGKVFQEMWQAFVSQHAAWFGAMKIEDIPSGRAAFIQRGSELVRKTETLVNSDERVGRAVQLFTAGLALLLVRQGWSFDAMPGRPVEVISGGRRLDPHAAILRLASGSMPREAWRNECEALGILGLSIADVPKPVG